MSKTILIVDDFRVSNEALGSLLMSEGYSIIAARSVDSALEVFDGRQIDLVITDFNMPKRNGIELVKEIRQMEKYNSIPILVLSSVRDEDKKKNAYDAKITGWIQKPLQMNKLLNAIKRAIS